VDQHFALRWVNTHVSTFFKMKAKKDGTENSNRSRALEGIQMLRPFGEKAQVTLHPMSLTDREIYL
jgi:hypothetical protein